MMKFPVIISIAMILTGCVQLKPVAVHFEAEHISHLTQHWPFTDHPTNYGSESLSVGLRWAPTKNTSVTVLEGYVPWHQLDEMSEIFQARISYEIPLKGN